MKALSYAWRRLRRGWRSGELFILALALAVAVAAVSAVNLFTERVRTALATQTGADLIYRSRKPLPETLIAGNSAVRSTEVVTLASVVFAGEASTLASIKAVGEGYPLRGTLTVTDAPFGDAKPASGVPPDC